MALADVNGYKALWHKYPNNESGYVLPYRLLYPNNYDPNKSYPLIVANHGSGEYGTNNTSQLGWGFATGYYGGDTPSQSFTDWECFVICPQFGYTAPDYQNQFFNNYDYSFEKFFWNGTNVLILSSPTAKSFFVQATIDLVKQIQNNNYIFYNDNLCQNAVELQHLNIDENRIYLVGASLGCVSNHNLAKEGRDIFAGIIQAMPLQFMYANTDLYRQSSDDYDSNFSDRLFKECERISHIPMYVVVGTSDVNSGYTAAQGYYQSLVDSGSDSLMVSINGTTHTESVLHTIFDKSKKINIESNTEQLTFAEQGLCGMDWLFSLNKTICPADKYFGEETNYYPNESIVILQSAYVRDSIYNEEERILLLPNCKEILSFVWFNSTVITKEYVTISNAETKLLTFSGTDLFNIMKYNNKLWKKPLYQCKFLA